MASAIHEPRALSKPSSTWQATQVEKQGIGNARAKMHVYVAMVQDERKGKATNREAHDGRDGSQGFIAFAQESWCKNRTIAVAMNVNTT